MMNNPYQSTPHSGISSPETTELVATPIALNYLQSSKGWVRFISVLAFIMFAFMCIGTLGSLVAIGHTGGLGLFMFVIMAAFATITFMLALRMSKYASAIGRITFTASPLDLEDAMVQQMKFWRLSGILICIFLAFMIIGLLGSL